MLEEVAKEQGVRRPFYRPSETVGRASDAHPACAQTGPQWMPRPSQVRKQQAEKEGGHRSSCGLEPRGYCVVLHDWRRRPLVGEVVLLKSTP